MPKETINLNYWDVIREDFFFRSMRTFPTLIGYQGLTLVTFEKPIIGWNRETLTIEYEDIFVALKEPSRYFILHEQLKSDSPASGDIKFYAWLDAWQEYLNSTLPI